MSNVIVKYHNDFNRIQLPSLTEQEQNILFSILAKIKNNNDNKPIRLFTEDIITGSVISKEHFTAIINSLKTKFFKASFMQIIETDTEIIDSNFHFFNTMDIHYQKKNQDDGYDNSKIFYYIDLLVNPRFEYLVNELTANFTAFELTEFISLSGKYSKTLYRLLKQFRSTGKAYFEWQDFMERMDIPSDYNMCNIDQRILKPAIAELRKPRNLFDKERIPFEKLQYTKLKNKGRGRGGKVVAIEFTFKPQVQEIQESKELPQDLKELENYVKKFERKHINSKDDGFCYIEKVSVDEKGRIKVMLYDNDKGKKQITLSTLQEFQEKIVNCLYH
ncbi:replication initiation protein [Helicobacter sp. MIT 00-7814]|uniref:replication initiation protein n=1 Tax=unclassified Helicobacter TaxID=2593540 RepID=UPI000E1EA184|nr:MULTISPECIES: replication initiation protein [unclassified Helicobacter]RDU51375.1 replication initiation protein [Helicobacter sp. MIT 00-7814]RDU51499.1 replication initiation protein [Helicobacter sp. MIT 99-10781]